MTPYLRRPRQAFRVRTKNSWLESLGHDKPFILRDSHEKFESLKLCVKLLDTRCRSTSLVIAIGDIIKIRFRT